MKKVGLALLAVGGPVALAFAAPPEWAGSLIERFPGTFLGLGAWQWAGLIALCVIGFGLHSIARMIGRKVMRLRALETGTPSLIGERSVRRGAGLLALALPWYAFLHNLGLPDDLANFITVAAQAITVLGGVLLVYGIWDAACDVIAHRASSVANAERLLVPVTRKLVRFLILVAGFILALGVFGVNITGLLAGVGIGGLVVALAAKDSVENVFGSLTILFDMPFALGDWVKIDKVEGIVEEINLRSTRIRTFEDSIVTLPNSNLIKAAVENYGARRYRRQRFHIRLSYVNEADSLAKFMQNIRDYLAEADEVVHEKTVVELNDMTEASAGVLVQCFFEADSFAEESRLRGELMLAVFRAQENSGVILVNTPVPHPPPPAEPMNEEELRKQVQDKDDIV